MLNSVITIECYKVVLELEYRRLHFSVMESRLLSLRLIQRCMKQQGRFLVSRILDLARYSWKMPDHGLQQSEQKFRLETERHCMILLYMIVLQEGAYQNTSLHLSSGKISKLSYTRTA